MLKNEKMTALVGGILRILVQRKLLVLSSAKFPSEYSGLRFRLIGTNCAKRKSPDLHIATEYGKQSFPSVSKRTSLNCDVGRSHMPNKRVSRYATGNGGIIGRINKAEFCLGFGGTAIVHEAGVLANIWNPIGWGDQVALFAGSAYCLTS